MESDHTDAPGVDTEMAPPPARVQPKSTPASAQSSSSSSSSSSSAAQTKTASDTASGSRKRKAQGAPHPVVAVKSKTGSGPSTRSVKDSNQGYEMRDKSKHFMHLVSNILHNRFSGMVAALLSTVLKPLLTYLDKARTACSTVRGSIEWHMSAAHRSLEFTLGNMWRQIHDVSFARDVGFADALDSDLGEEQSKEETLLANILLEVLVQVTSYAWASGLQYTSRYPMQFIKLLSSDTDIIDEALLAMREDWDMLEKLMAVGHHSSHMAAAAKEMQWPFQTWPREREADFMRPLPRELLHGVEMYAASFKSSVVNESSFNRLRGVSSGHSASVMGRVSRWSTLAHSTLLEDHGYAAVQVSAAGRAQGRQKFDKKDFETPPAHECSLGADMVSSLVNAKEYAHPSPLKDKLSSVSWLAWKHTGGSAEEYLKAWQSLLVVQGNIVQCQSQSVFGIAVSVTAYGITYLKLDTHDLGDGVSLFTYNGLCKPMLAIGRPVKSKATHTVITEAWTVLHVDKGHWRVPSP
eukprot:4787823-Amphidinium_carterae.5